MEFKKKILPNGLSVVGELNKAAKSASVGFFVKTGSRDESSEINGVSHFLEHMLFKGTESLSALEVNKAFDRTGAQFNAFTSEEATVYYAAVLPEYLLEISKLWMDLMRPSLRKEDFDIEKNVIKEEIAMYQDMPNFDVMDRCKGLYFKGHPCGYSVLGTNESIDALTAEQMRSYFGKRYVPNNMTLAVAGNFHWEKFVALAEANCGNWASGQVERHLSDWPGRVKEERLQKENLSREHICLMSPAVSAQDPLRFAASIFGVIVGDDSGSRFFWELVDKALADAAVVQLCDMDGTGAFYSYIRCAKEKVPEVIEKVKGVLDSVLKDGVTADELRKAKNKILSALVLKNELPMGRLRELGINWMYLQQCRSVQDDIDAYEAVTTKDIQGLVKTLNLGNFTQFSIGP